MFKITSEKQFIRIKYTSENVVIRRNNTPDIPLIKGPKNKTEWKQLPLINGRQQNKQKNYWEKSRIPTSTNFIRKMIQSFEQNVIENKIVEKPKPLFPLVLSYLFYEFFFISDIRGVA